MKDIQIGKKKYSVVKDGVLRDEGLSWGAKGLYAFLCTLSEDWVVRRKDLLQRSPDGEKKLRGYLKELRDRGCLWRQYQRQNGRIVGSVLMFEPDGIKSEPLSVEVEEPWQVAVGKGLPERKKWFTGAGGMSFPFS